MLRSGLAPLSVRDFRTYFIGRSVSYVGASLVPVALAFAVLEELSGTVALGAVLAAQTVPQVAFLLAGGVLSDRYSRRRVLLVSVLGMGSAQGASGVLLISGRADVVSLMVLQALYGTARAIYSPASSGIVRDLLPPQQVQTGVSLVSTSQNVAAIGGPILAGLLTVTTGPGVALVINAFTFYASALSLARIAPTARPGGGSRASFVGELREGWVAFRDRSWVWSMVLGFSAYQGVVLPSIFVLGPSIARDEGFGASGWAVVLAAQGVGALGGAVAVLWWRPRRPLVASTLLVILESGFLVALSVGSTVPVLVPLAALGAAGVVVADALWSATLQTHVPEDLVSRVSSFDWLGSLAMYPIGVATAGILSTHVGLGTLVLAAAAINVAVRVLVLALPSIWRVTAVDDR